jgi:single-strand DNA-binding protein
MKFTPQGTPVCTFSVATNEKRRGREGEQQDVTTWFRVTVWGRQAETASKYLTKGRSVYVEGRLHVDEWTDKQGKTRFTLEVNATDVQFLGGDREGIPTRAGASDSARAASASSNSSRVASPAEEFDDDSIPF